MTASYFFGATPILPVIGEVMCQKASLKFEDTANLHSIGFFSDIILRISESRKLMKVTILVQTYFDDKLSNSSNK